MIVGAGCADSFVADDRLMSTLLPQAFWFRVAHSSPRVEAIPRPKGRLLDLTEAHGLLDLGQLDGRPNWVRVRSGWNARGLGFSFELVDKLGDISPEPARPSGIDTVQLWVDTRDTRTVHRATRFCHRFVVTLMPGVGRTLDVAVTQKSIARALADPPMTGGAKVVARAERTASGWRLELFLPAEALVGFDPDENRRLGLAYQVTDPDRGEIFSGVGREFPIGEDPSLWATLILNDDP